MNPAANESSDTERLLGAARAGERSAFDRLFERHRDYLHRMIDTRLDSRLRRRVDASDIVQETQLEAFRRFHDYIERRPMPFHLWLRRTAEERLLMARRHHVGAAKRSAGYEVSLPDRSSLVLARQLLDGAPSPSELLAGRELAERVRACMTELSDADREILFMRNFERLSNQEIAALLEMDPKTVSKRHGRALLRLRDLLLDGGVRESQL